MSLCTFKLLSQLAKAESVTFKNAKLIVGCLQLHPQTSLPADGNVLLGLAVSFSYAISISRSTSPPAYKADPDMR